MTALQAVLFDLDDTLLGNRMEEFLPRYFMLLARYAQQLAYDGDFIAAVIASTQTVIANTDPARTNRAVFWSDFTARTGLDPVATERFFEQFYAEQFPALKATTAIRPIAAPLVDLCLARGLRVVVATNPLFPTTAIEQRLAWAGLPVTRYPFDLVTTMDNMHAAKPNAAYYREILDAIDCAPEQALVVGDSWENDVEPALRLGMPAYWVATDDPAATEAGPHVAEQLVGIGTLAAFYDWLVGAEHAAAGPPARRSG